MKKTLGLVEKH